jgi:hypothetical protein
MANITPISGKNGKIVWASNILYLQSWKLDLKVDLEEFAHFGMSSDSTNLTFKQLVDGFASGTVDVEGKFDNTAAAYLNSSKTLYPQVQATCQFLYNSTVGWTCNGVVESIGPSQSVDGPFGLYSAKIRITSMVFTTTG